MPLCHTASHNEVDNFEPKLYCECVIHYGRSGDCVKPVLVEFQLQRAPLPSQEKSRCRVELALQVRNQLLSSLSPSRINFSVGISSPSRATIRASAAEAWALE